MWVLHAEFYCPLLAITSRFHLTLRDTRTLRSSLAAFNTLRDIRTLPSSLAVELYQQRPMCCVDRCFAAAGSMRRWWRRIRTWARSSQTAAGPRVAPPSSASATSTTSPHCWPGTVKVQPGLCYLLPSSIAPRAFISVLTLLSK